MVTTDYGTWNNHGDRSNLTLEATVIDFINGGDADWRECVEATGAFDAMVADYRQAINDALPAGVSLCGNQFYGPYHFAGCDWDGELDIAEIIRGVDLTAIVERHDPDSASVCVAEEE